MVYTGPFVDRYGHRHNPEVDGWHGECKKESYWLKLWRKRYCYIVDNMLFIAKHEDAAPYDVIDLAEPNIILSMVPVKSEVFPVIIIKGCTYSRFKIYRLKFSWYDEWYSSLNRILTLANLQPLSTVPFVHFPFKFVCINFVLDWLTLKDYLKLDSALCNKAHRAILYSLFNEFGPRFSQRYFHAGMVLYGRFFRWAVKRKLTATSFHIGDYQLLPYLLRRNLYDFSSITRLFFEFDSIMFYELLVRCPNLVQLNIHGVNNLRRLLSALIVNNRQLSVFSWHRIAFEPKTVLFFVMHHRCMSILTKDDCPFNVFKAGVWHQRPRESFALLHHSPVQIKELCLSTNTILSLKSLEEEADDMLADLLHTQTNLTNVSLSLGSKALLHPALISRCANITYLHLNRQKANVSVDWSCLMDSAMRVKTAIIYMDDECFFKYAAKILSTATSITFSNNVVTDADMSAVLKSNQSRLTELFIYSSNALTGQFLNDLGQQCSRLKSLRLANSPLMAGEFARYAQHGCMTVQRLVMPVFFMSSDTPDLLKAQCPALRHLCLHCSNESRFSVVAAKHLLDVLGVQLIHLGLEYYPGEWKSEVIAYAETIERCCEVV